jgi:phage tail sheath protein FI
MPVTPTYPGVYVEEISSGVRTIVGVATSITAFVGRTLRGLTNDPLMCNSFGDFERNFGGLHEDYPLSYAVRDFFVNGGSQALIVRLTAPNFASDAQRTAALADNQKAIAAGKAVSDAVQAAADLPAAKAAAKGINDPIQAAADNVKSKAEKAAAQAVTTAVNAAADLDSAKKAAVAAIPSALATAGKSWLSLPGSGAGVDPLVLEASSDGSWGDTLRARVDLDGVDMAKNRYPGLAPADLFNLTVCDVATGAIERFINLTWKDSPRRVDRVLSNESSLVRVKGAVPGGLPKETDQGISPADKKVIPFSEKDVATSVRSVGVIAANRGANGGTLTWDDYTSRDGLQDGKLGLYALSRADLFNILCLPPDQRGAQLPDGLLPDALAYCVDRRAMLIVDPPLNWTDAQAITANNNAALTALGLTGNAARNAAVYFPRVIQPDPKREGQPDTFVPCGIVAGIMARTDVARGVWKAPAGLEAGVLGVQKLAVNLNNAENGMLNPLAVNCLRTFPISGTVVWGARTIRGADQLADEYKYVPVRRLALFIEESLFRGLQWVVFEPNDSPLWAQIRLNVGAFMHDLFVKGAFQGSTPRDAYFVKCDAETTPQNDINLGIVNVVVGFAPLKPAEFVILKLQQMAGQIQV